MEVEEEVGEREMEEEEEMGIASYLEKVECPNLKVLCRLRDPRHADDERERHGECHVPAVGESEKQVVEPHDLTGKQQATSKPHETQACKGVEKSTRGRSRSKQLKRGRWGCSLRVPRTMDQSSHAFLVSTRRATRVQSGPPTKEPTSIEKAMALSTEADLQRHGIAS